MSALRTVLVAAAAATFASAVASAQDAPASSDTTISISPPMTLTSPAVAPADFPGVPSARRGKPLPRGYVAVGHRVSVTLGERRAYPAFTIACPRGKTLRTFASQPGQRIAVQIVGPTPIIRERGFDYVGESRWAVLGSYGTDGLSVGDQFTGMVYGLCR